MVAESLSLTRYGRGSYQMVSKAIVAESLSLAGKIIIKAFSKLLDEKMSSFAKG
jgi:hypothetical protein